MEEESAERGADGDEDGEQDGEDWSVALRWVWVVVHVLIILVFFEGVRPARSGCGAADAGLVFERVELDD